MTQEGVSLKTKEVFMTRIRFIVATFVASLFLLVASGAITGDLSTSEKLHRLNTMKFWLYAQKERKAAAQFRVKADAAELNVSKAMNVRDYGSARVHRLQAFTLRTKARHSDKKAWQHATKAHQLVTKKWSVSKKRK